MLSYDDRRYYFLAAIFAENSHTCFQKTAARYTGI